MPLLALTLAFASALNAAPPAAPRIDAIALDGSAVHLPGPPPTRATVLVMGFSEKSSSEAADWARRLKSAPWAHQQAEFYEVPVLEGLPKILRGVVLHAIRNSTPAAAQAWVVPIFSEEKEWRSAAAVGGDKDVYLVVLDKDWHVRWSASGACTDALYAQLSSQVQAAQE